jgi:hypothetical protein
MHHRFNTSPFAKYISVGNAICRAIGILKNIVFCLLTSFIFLMPHVIYKFSWVQIIWVLFCTSGSFSYFRGFYCIIRISVPCFLFTALPVINSFAAVKRLNKQYVYYYYYYYYYYY